MIDVSGALEVACECLCDLLDLRHRDEAQDEKTRAAKAAATYAAPTLRRPPAPDAEREATRRRMRERVELRRRRDRGEGDPRD